MFRLSSIVLAITGLAVAQQTSFPQETGTRSLWIPFQTISGIPVASIAYNDSSANVTAYVISCPSGQPSCAIAPNLTLTEGISTVGYKLSTSGQSISLGCKVNGTTSAVCSEQSGGNGNIQKPPASTLSPDQIVYQAVLITATNNNTSTMPSVITITAHSTTSSTSSSSSGGAMATNGPWMFGGAVGAGLVALAAL